MNKINKKTLESFEGNPHWDCVNAIVRETGEVVAVRNLNAFEPNLVPEFVQVASDATELRYFKRYELEF